MYMPRLSSLLSMHSSAQPSGLRQRSHAAPGPSDCVLTKKPPVIGKAWGPGCSAVLAGQTSRMCLGPQAIAPDARWSQHAFHAPQTVMHVPQREGEAQYYAQHSSRWVWVAVTIGDA